MDILQAGGASPLLFSLSEVGVVIVGINMTILAYLHQNASSSKAFNFKPGCSLFKESLHAPGGIFPGQHKSLALGCCFQGYNPHKKSLTKSALKFNMVPMCTEYHLYIRCLFSQYEVGWI